MIRRLKLILLISCLSLAGILLSSTGANATHLRAGEITVQRLSCTSLSFRITITVYTNTGSAIKFGSGDLYFGDGSPVHHTPTRDNVLRPDLGPDVGTVSYSIDHTYSGPGKYVISYLEPNRNAGILNMFNSVETKFYIETVIIIDPIFGCNNSPRLLVPPIDKACTGAAWFHNPGAYDPDGDSLSFEMTIPKKEKDVVVDNYRDPHVKEFYDVAGLSYGEANEDGDGPPTFAIDSRTGTITWDAPGAAGEYNISFLIKEWRKIPQSGDWVQLGYVTRDMQIIVVDCLNKRPELAVPTDLCVEAGTLITQDIFGTDPDNDQVKIEVFSQLLTISPSSATYTPRPPVYQSTSSATQAKLSFQWQTTCEHVKSQAYQVVFKITDNPPQGKGAKLVQFKTWNIRVVGPAPKWTSANINLTNRSAVLKWENYVCSNAATMQIWRRVDQFNFDPPQCVTGIPAFMGYSKVGEVPINTSTFTDTNGGSGLAVGAAYCYRLVAKFPQPDGSESYVSKDICLPPILANAPIITHVTIDKTSNTAGQITVKWRSPFDVSKAQFPPPYSYEVSRAEGFSGDAKLVKVNPGLRIPDSTFVDTPINTESTVYNYRIKAYDANGVFVGTSSVASSVRLEAKSQTLKIELAWNANVPWSIRNQDYPRHLIYRGKANDTESQFVLIDSVNVNEKLLHYIDSGQYNNTPLKESDVYCYRILTRGTYGNPKIEAPLLNFSQKICAQPSDDEKPCQPELSIIAVDCSQYLLTSSCAPTTFSNTLTWNHPKDEACRADVRSYTVYIASVVGGEFTKYVTDVRDTFFIDTNLPSFARCYKIAAVDRSGNESDLSESFCFDNCPYYELPNVFTPNGDACNEKFSAYSDRTSVDENGNGPCGPVDLEDLRKKCARFVSGVHFKVYNRWGTEVYDYQSGGERNIYIDWDGRDPKGHELPTGVYYYIAYLTFDVVDPSRQNQEVKGWVHLIR